MININQKKYQGEYYHGKLITSIENSSNPEQPVRKIEKRKLW